MPLLLPVSIDIAMPWHAVDAPPFRYRYRRYLDALVLKRKDAEMQAERKRKQQASR
jgi:hypothetical protein